MFAIISWFLFVPKQNKSLVLICLRSSFCSSHKGEGVLDVLLNALLRSWIFMTQNIFWIVIFNIWLLFCSVWLEKPPCWAAYKRLGAHSPLCEGCWAQSSGLVFSLAWLGVGEPDFFCRSPRQVDFKAALWHPNARLRCAQSVTCVPGPTLCLYAGHHSRVWMGMLDLAGTSGLCDLLGYPIPLLFFPPCVFYPLILSCPPHDKFSPILDTIGSVTG